MSRFFTLREELETIWKGRKPQTPEQLMDLAGRMDESLGKWPEDHGSRQAAVEHFVRLGRSGSLAQKDAKPGSPEHMAYKFATDQMRHARAAVVKRAPKLVSGDTLSGKIDKEHLEHYAGKWADHFDALEHAPRQVKEIDGEDVPVLPTPKSRQGSSAAKVFQRRPLIGEKQIKHMKSQGISHVASMDDFNIIHSGVERAINAGKVSEGDANRYAVMRSAFQTASKRHPENRPGLPFQPSYTSFDSGALRAMSAGLEHLDETGFREAKTRLAPVISGAMAAQAKHPMKERTPGWHRSKTMYTTYPDLHPIGSDAHQRQEVAFQTAVKNSDKRRNKTPGTPASASPASAPAVSKLAAAAKEVDLPASWDEYTKLRDAGKITDPQVHIKMERKRREERAAAAMNKSLASVKLLRSLAVWRRTA